MTNADAVYEDEALIDDRFYLPVGITGHAILSIH